VSSSLPVLDNISPLNEIHFQLPHRTNWSWFRVVKLKMRQTTSLSFAICVPGCTNKNHRTFFTTNQWIALNASRWKSSWSWTFNFVWLLDHNVVTSVVYSFVKLNTLVERGSRKKFFLISSDCNNLLPDHFPSERHCS